LAHAFAARHLREQVESMERRRQQMSNEVFAIVKNMLDRGEHLVQARPAERIVLQASVSGGAFTPALILIIAVPSLRIDGAQAVENRRFGLIQVVKPEERFGARRTRFKDCCFASGERPARTKE
jgi:hypothetical protein